MRKLLNNWEDNCISDSATLLETLNRLDAVWNKILFVVSKDGRLMGSVTDGDVRRAILRGTALDACVADFAYKNPITMRDDADDTSLAETEKRDLRAIPVIDKTGVIVGIYNIDSESNTARESVDIPVVMMAGGKGTRLYPYTKILPKPLIPIDDIPISERIIRQFENAGCHEFHMIVNYRKNMIKSYFSEIDAKYNIEFHDEDTPLGTAGGLKLVEGSVSGTFVMTNCDIIILEEIAEIVKHHKTSGNAATMVCSLKNYEIPYGVVHFGEGGNIESFEEKPKMSFFTNTGYYVLEKEIFNHISENERIDMPDVLERMMNAGQKVGVYPIGENMWLDMGQFDSMESMEIRLKELDGRNF